MCKLLKCIIRHYRLTCTRIMTYFKYWASILTRGTQHDQCNINIASRTKCLNSQWALMCELFPRLSANVRPQLPPPLTLPNSLSWSLIIPAHRVGVGCHVSYFFWKSILIYFYIDPWRRPQGKSRLRGTCFVYFKGHTT